MQGKVALLVFNNIIKGIRVCCKGMREGLLIRIDLLNPLMETVPLLFCLFFSLVLKIILYVRLSNPIALFQINALDFFV